MFSQMRTLPAEFYHSWAGFEDGHFLGYYDNGVNGDCDGTTSGSKCHTFAPGNAPHDGTECLRFEFDHYRTTTITHTRTVFHGVADRCELLVP